jgi:hypothetical protein
MHQLKAAPRRNGGAVENLRQTLRALLKTNYQAEAILQMMLAEAVRAFPGLTLQDHRSIVSCVIEDATTANDDALPADKPGTLHQTFDNVIPFSGKRERARMKG